MSKVDLIQLAKEIRVMNRQNALYRVLRDELKTRGFWRWHKRGDSALGYKIMRERRNVGEQYAERTKKRVSSQ